MFFLRRILVAAMHKAYGVWLVGALAVLGLNRTTPVRALPQPAAAAVDVERLGPKVGETLPDFTLPDQHGTNRSLKSLIGPKGAILVFFRSADW
jgi:cytochrome oxidase Cu insertion factor (SCO1/SenC/PrrC family)